MRPRPPADSDHAADTETTSIRLTTLPPGASLAALTPTPTPTTAPPAPFPLPGLPPAPRASSTSIARGAHAAFDPELTVLSDQRVAFAPTLAVSIAAAAAAAPPPAAPAVLAPGGRIGKYELRERLGMGTFGLVFTARDADLDRDVALKVLNPMFITNRDVLARFLQEARASARIHHPGIVTVFDFGRVAVLTGETAFITMELLHGESLTSRLTRTGRLAPDLACEIARQVASALEAAHRADVLHRDLKPDNIYLVPDPAVPSGERVKVLDFGLAKLGRAGHTMVNTVFGTPRYMSPEQCRSAGEIDARSDVYALGCVLFELLTNRTPFEGDLRQLLDQHQRAPAPRARALAPELPPALDELVASMLAKDPAARPQTMGEVQRALLRLGLLPAAAPVPPSGAAAVPPSGAAPVPPSGAAPILGSGQRPAAPSEAEILVPARPAAGPRNPALMLPPVRPRRRARDLAIASAVALAVAATLAAIATRAPALAGPPAGGAGSAAQRGAASSAPEPRDRP